MDEHDEWNISVDQMIECGAWTLVREIGRGASGVVYLATNARGEVVAVKVCRREELGIERYARELRGAKMYCRIPVSEGLIRLLELVECEWGFYTVMELADDEFGERPNATPEYHPKTLSRVIAGEKALPVRESLKLGLALAGGLVTLQRHHLLHRDVKPGNVVYVRGRPLLSDPGLVVEEADAVSLVGTPGYVPPENFVGTGGDVYSLGVTLKAASFGRSVDELEKGPTLEADTGHPLFASWWRILNKATHPDASRRYRSAKAMLRDLNVLRFRTVLSVFTRGWLLFIELVLLALLVGFCLLAISGKSDLGVFAAWSEQARKKAAEQALADFVARRVEEEKASLRQGLQELRDSLEVPEVNDVSREGRGGARNGVDVE